MIIMKITWTVFMSWAYEQGDMVMATLDPIGGPDVKNARHFMNKAIIAMEELEEDRLDRDLHEAAILEDLCMVAFHGAKACSSYSSVTPAEAHKAMKQKLLLIRGSVRAL